jgi:hypothetical protein
MWFTFARTLVTRSEMESTIANSPTAIRVEALMSRVDRNDGAVNDLREDMCKLREAIVKLTTILEQLTK